MKIQKEQHPARLRLLVLLPIVITFSLALIAIIISTKTFFTYQQQEENKATALRIQNAFQELVNQDIADIRGLLLLIENKPEIGAAWLTQDRQQLINATAATYKSIESTFNITHFYFHSLDGKNFLRMHRPGRFGDNINRKTFLAAQRTGNTSAGLEVGTFGQFVLRVVRPWVIDGKLAGYIELGQEIGHITHGLKSPNTEVISLIDKQLINKNDWQKVFGGQFAWQQLDRWVIASSTTAAIPDDINLITQEINTPQISRQGNKKQTFIASRFTLTDFSRSDVGFMVILQNITPSTQKLSDLMRNIVIIGCIIIFILSIGYFIYLKKIEDRLAFANRSLYKKIGDHKRAENKLRINRDELAAINRELESYSYSIAHDLRAPLRSVTSFSQIVLEDAKDKLNEDETDNLNRVISASVRMAELIDDILQLSRITREELSKSKVNLSKLVDRNHHHLSSQDPTRNVEWDIQDNVVVIADPRLMERAIENLINNAWKYTSHTDNAKITFGTINKNNETVYFVRDNGAGFDMNYAHKLFATFQRLHNPREFTGSGVGLAIVLRVIQRHHGRIWGEGEVGKGATFYFTLPDSPSI